MNEESLLGAGCIRVVQVRCSRCKGRLVRDVLQ